MARYFEPTPEQETSWAAWVAERPDDVRTVAERFFPWELYRIKSTGQRCTLVSFGEQEDGKVTVRVNVTGDFNLTIFDRQVFGIDPDDLEPCELPKEEDPTGTLLTEDDDIERFVDAVYPAYEARRS